MMITGMIMDISWIVHVSAVTMIIIYIYYKLTKRL